MVSQLFTNSSYQFPTIIDSSTETYPEITEDEQFTSIDSHAPEEREERDFDVNELEDSFDQQMSLSESKSQDIVEKELKSQPDFEDIKEVSEDQEVNPSTSILTVSKDDSKDSELESLENETERDQEMSLSESKSQDIVEKELKSQPDFEDIKEVSEDQEVNPSTSILTVSTPDFSHTDSTSSMTDSISSLTLSSQTTTSYPVAHQTTISKADVSRPYVIDSNGHPVSLTGWKATAYNAALLAPLLLCSAAGWVVGFMVGGNLGAAAGDALGTALGCVISFGIELALRKFVLNDPTLDANMKELIKIRLGQGVILSVGAFVGGLMFNPAYKWSSQISNSTLHSLAASAISTLGCAIAMQVTRAVYTVAAKGLGKTANEHLKLSAHNLVRDSVMSTTILFGAQTFLYGTVAPLFSTKILAGQSHKIAKAAVASTLGGELGLGIQEVGERVVHMAQHHFNSKHHSPAAA